VRGRLVCRLKYGRRVEVRFKCGIGYVRRRLRLRFRREGATSLFSLSG